MVVKTNRREQLDIKAAVQWLAREASLESAIYENLSLTDRINFRELLTPVFRLDTPDIYAYCRDVSGEVDQFDVYVEFLEERGYRFWVPKNILPSVKLHKEELEEQAKTEAAEIFTKLSIRQKLAFYWNEIFPN